jgi:membrane fusion protein (multidrug efflux system)
MNRKHYLKWIFMICLVTGFGSCDQKEPKLKLTSYETLIVEKQDITVPVKFSAKMKGRTDVLVSPQVSGQLTQIAVTEGQQVKKGTVLFVIDPRNAQLDLEAALATLEAALAVESSSKQELESTQNLFEKNIVSRYMLTDAENAYKHAQAAVKEARATANRARVTLGFCTITAPVSGVIGEIPVRTGVQVSPGTLLTIVSGNSNMDAEFSVTESLVEEMVQHGVTTAEKEKYIASLPDVTFVMKNGTEYPHKGRITSMTGVVNATTGSLSCKASFPNPDGHLYSGIQGTVVLPNAEKDVIVIPQKAVVRLQDKSLVYKVKADSTATAVDVTVEDAGNGQDCIVTSGLNVGDQIVTIGANNVKEGQQVLFPEEKIEK